MPPPRGYARSPGAHPEYHAHLSRNHEEGFSGPSVWSSPAERLDVSPDLGSPYSDERTCECSLIWFADPFMFDPYGQSPCRVAPGVFPSFLAAYVSMPAGL